MGSWHNFSHDNIYQCCVKKEFRILSNARRNTPAPPVREADFTTLPQKVNRENPFGN
jgi:hypothetical protein